MWQKSFYWAEKLLFTSKKSIWTGKQQEMINISKG